MKVAEFMKRYEARHPAHMASDYGLDHSLRTPARQRASHPAGMHSGTVHDWEDLERYQQELERLYREGPGRSSGAH